MTMTHDPRSHRRLDLAGLALFLVGLVCAVLSLWAINDRGVTPLIMVPSIVAATVGATHLTKREVPRD